MGAPVGIAVAHDGALLVSEDGNSTIWRSPIEGATHEHRAIAEAEGAGPRLYPAGDVGGGISRDDGHRRHRLHGGGAGRCPRTWNEITLDAAVVARQGRGGAIHAAVRGVRPPVAPTSR